MIIMNSVPSGPGDAEAYNLDKFLNKRTVVVRGTF
jgi:hypothetical protein